MKVKRGRAPAVGQAEVVTTKKKRRTDSGPVPSSPGSPSTASTASAATSTAEEPNTPADVAQQTNNSPAAGGGEVLPVVSPPGGSRHGEETVNEAIGELLRLKADKSDLNLFIKNKVKQFIWPICKIPDRGDGVSMENIKKYMKMVLSSKEMDDEKFEQLWNGSVGGRKALKKVVIETLRQLRAYVLQKMKADYYSKFALPETYYALASSLL